MKFAGFNLSTKWTRKIGKRFIASSFRVVALLVAIIHLLYLTTDRNDVLAPLILIVGVTLYTGFRLAIPSKWYQTNWCLFLLALDVVVSATLIVLSGELHGPFVLYSLTPVVTSALLLSRRVTLTTAAVTGFYATVIFFMNPLAVAVDHLSSELAIYWTALSLTAMLPYVINVRSQQLLQARAGLDERSRIGREIHDGICQDVFGARWEIQILRKDPQCSPGMAVRLRQVESMLEQAESNIRGSLDLLRTIRRDRPLLPQIEASLKRVENEAGIHCLLVAEGGEPALDEIIKLEVLHICGEALQNVVKHSQANNLTLKVQSRNAHVRVNIIDDGCGFDSARARRGHGLLVMKERAESIGGRLKANSLPGMGTEIQVEVPSQCPMELPVPS